MQTLDSQNKQVDAEANNYPGQHRQNTPNETLATQLKNLTLNTDSERQADYHWQEKNLQRKAVNIMNFIEFKAEFVENVGEPIRSARNQIVHIQEEGGILAKVTKDLNGELDLVFPCDADGKITKACSHVVNSENMAMLRLLDADVPYLVMCRMLSLAREHLYNKNNYENGLRWDEVESYLNEWHLSVNHLKQRLDEEHFLQLKSQTLNHLKHINSLRNRLAETKVLPRKNKNEFKRNVNANAMREGQGCEDNETEVKRLFAEYVDNPEDVEKHFKNARREATSEVTNMGQALHLLNSSLLKQRQNAQRDVCGKRNQMEKLLRSNPMLICFFEAAMSVTKGTRDDLSEIEFLYRDSLVNVINDCVTKASSRSLQKKEFTTEVNYWERAANALISKQVVSEEDLSHILEEIKQVRSALGKSVSREL